MPNELMLDALDPPNATALLRDMRQVGAQSVAFYVFRRTADGVRIGTGTWSPSHIVTVQSDGRKTLPIFVTGNVPQIGDVQACMLLSVAMGSMARALVFDIETNSLPEPGWLANAIDIVRAAKWKAIRYGDESVLAQYPPGDGDWLSHGKVVVRANQLFPVPALPDGVVGDQYTVGVLLNGSEYDGSIVSDVIFGGAPSAPRENIGMGGKINMAPFSADRVDVCVVGDDSNIYRSFGAGGAGGLDQNRNWFAVDSEHAPAGGFDDVDWTWDNLGRMLILGFATTGALYLCVVRSSDGGYDQNWSRLPVNVKRRDSSAPQQPALAVDNVLRNYLLGGPKPG